MEQVPFGPSDFGRNVELAENTEQRCPCVLLLDVSSSMAGEPITQLNEGLIVYKDELSADSLAAKRVDVCVITFGSEVNTVCDFTTAGNFMPPTLQANGLTYMGQAVSLGMDLLERRKAEYRANGIPYYRPWVFLISDGAPNDPDWESAAARAIEAQKAKKFQMFCVGVAGADMGVLKKFCVGEPVTLKGLRFRDMFSWLSSSQSRVSQSRPGEEVILDNPTAPSGWASIA